MDFGFWFPRNVSDGDPSIWLNIAALGLAVLSTYGANRMVKSQRKCRERKMRGLARDAVKMATPFDLPGNLNKEEFIKVCAQPSEYNEEEKEERGEIEGEIRARLEFYASVGADSRDYYLPDGSERLSASYLVALLTDLPPTAKTITVDPDGLQGR